MQSRHVTVDEDVFYKTTIFPQWIRDESFDPSYDINQYVEETPQTWTFEASAGSELPISRNGNYSEALASTSSQPLPYQKMQTLQNLRRRWYPTPKPLAMPLESGSLYEVMRDRTKAILQYNRNEKDKVSRHVDMTDPVYDPPESPTTVSSRMWMEFLELTPHDDAVTPYYGAQQIASHPEPELDWHRESQRMRQLAALYGTPRFDDPSYIFDPADIPAISSFSSEVYNVAPNYSIPNDNNNIVAPNHSNPNDNNVLAPNHSVPIDHNTTTSGYDFIGSVDCDVSSANIGPSHSAQPLLASWQSSGEGNIENASQRIQAPANSKRKRGKEPEHVGPASKRGLGGPAKVQVPAEPSVTSPGDGVGPSGQNRIEVTDTLFTDVQHEGRSGVACTYKCPITGRNCCSILMSTNKCSRYRHLTIHAQKEENMITAGKMSRNQAIVFPHLAKVVVECTSEGCDFRTEVWRTNRVLENHEKDVHPDLYKKRLEKKQKGKREESVEAP